MKKLSYLLFACIALACVSCSTYEEQMQPRNIDDQTRIGGYLSATVESIDSSLTPRRGIIVVTVKNNDPRAIYVNGKNLRIEIIDPSTKKTVVEIEDDFTTRIAPFKTENHQFNLGFIKELLLGKTYDIKAAFGYHGALSGSGEPILYCTKTVSSTVVSRLQY